MEWIELVLPAGDLADEVAALLASICAALARGVEVRGEEVVAWVPVGEEEPALAELRAAADQLIAAGFPIDVGKLRAQPAAPEAEWRDAWKRHFHVNRIGRRLVIVPSWERHDAVPGDVVLDLDPGRAFGTGAHASTRLCLLALEDLDLPVARFLDVGTGSGILSIAAAKLWPASTGVAVDVDPISVGAARENLERNGVLERVGLDEALPGGVFDLVMANIQADVLLALRETLSARTGAALLLSGLLDEQVDAVVAAYPGFAAARVLAEGGWSAVVLRRP